MERCARQGPFGEGASDKLCPSSRILKKHAFGNAEPDINLSGKPSPKLYYLCKLSKMRIIRGIEEKVYY
jgi:hypothetical protein